MFPPQAASRRNRFRLPPKTAISSRSSVRSRLSRWRADKCCSPRAIRPVPSGTLRIRSGGVIYEDVGAGGIVGEMALVERDPARSATVYALADCELIAVDEARFSELVSEAPRFALIVMQILSRRLRAMDRRYRPEPLVAREPLEP